MSLVNTYKKPQSDFNCSQIALLVGRRVKSDLPGAIGGQVFSIPGRATESVARLFDAYCSRNTLG